MNQTRKKVVIGFVGTNLDYGFNDKRWTRWRPTVSLFGHESFKPDGIELLTFKQGHETLTEQIERDIRSLSPGARVHLHDLRISDAWDFPEVFAALQDFAKGYEFDENTDYFVHLTTGSHVAQICLFLLAESRYLPARLVETGMDKSLPQDAYWRGKLSIIDLDLAAYDDLAKRAQRERETSQHFLKGGIVTRNAAFNAQINRLERVALKSRAPLLITGPTGAGKSALAKRVHELRSMRHLVSGGLVEVNCATLRGDGAMSALFGHKKGAFTGAVADRSGLLRSAQGGTLFLDEVGELGAEEQAMLLRALEEKRFMPVGSDAEVESDFLLVAGTNRDLAKAVAEGSFRADLLARINVWHFRLPGLAERPEDIEPNLTFELERISGEMGDRITMTREARDQFVAFAQTAPWPGNFRDLSAAVTRMATLSDRGRIGVDDVSLECEELRRAWSYSSPPSAPKNSVDRILASMSIDRFDRAQLKEVLEVIASTGSLAEAGRELFAVSRLNKAKPNDSDRTRKYLVQNGLDYRALKAQLSNPIGTMET